MLSAIKFNLPDLGQFLTQKISTEKRQQTCQYLHDQTTFLACTCGQICHLPCLFVFSFLAFTVQSGRQYGEVLLTCIAKLSYSLITLACNHGQLLATYHALLSASMELSSTYHCIPVQEGCHEVMCIQKCGVS